MYRFLLLLFILVCVACGGGPRSNAPLLPGNWDQQLRMTMLEDINPQDDVVEVELEAREVDVVLTGGKTTRMWAYNGIVPGPLIEAQVGDTLIVHLQNNLPEETTIHWHGVEVPALMDGSHLSQQSIKPGERFSYSFTLTRAATYWYHPHIKSAEQVEKGLYGALIVRDKEEDQRLSLPENELVLFLDDILLDDQAQLNFDSAADPLVRASQQANGREGNFFMINGHVIPLRDNAFDVPAIKVRSGVPIRLRMINSANARFFRVSSPDFPFYVIGGDGGLNSATRRADPVNIQGFDEQGNLLAKMSARHSENINYLSNPDLNRGVMLVPGERADIIFTPVGIAGENKFIEWHYHDRGVHSAQYDSQGQIVLSHDHSEENFLWFSRLLRLEFVQESEWTDEIYEPPTLLKNIQAIDYQASSVLPVTFGHENPDGEGNIVFFATMKNGKGIPFEELDNTHALKAVAGRTYIWEITNLSQGDHPFHPHGFSFQWIDTRYEDTDVPQNNRTEDATNVEWKDTIRIPGRPGAKGRSKTVTRLAVRFDDRGREGLIAASGRFPGAGRSGGWFVHCHILGHSARGMATYLELSPAS